MAAWMPSVTIETGGSAAAVATLREGSVLVVEGFSTVVEGVTNDQAEFVDVYDPTTAKADYVGSLTERRTGLTATQLEDGSILFAGGVETDGPAVSTLEIYKLSR
jgi:hypothetical protein